MKRIIFLVTVALLMTLFAGVANAEPPIGGSGAHAHHVHTGNGGCVNIDKVLFSPEERGLHQGASASGSDGPAHRTCEAPHSH